MEDAAVRKLMVVVTRFLLLCAVGLSLTLLVFAVSFDCNKAKTLVEQTICSNTELSSLDDQVAARYKEALQTTENKESVKTDQRKWLTTRNNCKEVDCLKEVYVKRISELDRLPSPPGLPNTTEVAQAAPSATDIETLINKGDLAGAHSGIEQVIREKPNSAKAYYLYAQILHAQRQDAQARQALDTAERLNPAMDFASPGYLAKLKAELGMAGVAAEKRAQEQEPKRTRQEAGSQQVIQLAHPEVMGRFRWLRTPQNCSIWAPIDFNPDHILKIESCKDNKAYGKVIVTSNKADGQEYYFYDGFFISSEKECFADVQAYKPRLHIMPGDPLPLVYIGDISNLSDNELIFKFGTGTTIWVKVSSGSPQMMNDELCNRIFSGHDHRSGQQVSFRIAVETS